MILDALIRTTRRSPQAAAPDVYTRPSWWPITNESGVTVNGDTALTYSSVFAAVSIISGDLASLPLDIFGKQPNGDRQVDQKHPAQFLLNRSPNEIMTAETFRETMQYHTLLWGNGYSVIQRSMSKPAQLLPLLPDRTRVEIVNNQPVYVTKLGKSLEDRPFAAEDVLHIKGLGFDGVCGHSVIWLARNSWGLGMASERHGNRFFRNDARPGVVLKTPNRVDEETAKKILDAWEERHGANPNRPGLLSGGMDLTPLSLSNEDSEWLAGRKFQRQEVASWFLLPTHKLGDDNRSYNSVEVAERVYLNMTLRRWLRKWEAEVDRKLLTEREYRSGNRFSEHNTNALVQGDIATRFAAYATAIQNEWMSPDEVRRRENMNARPDGKGGVFRNPNTKSAGDSEADRTESDPQAAQKKLLASRFEKIQTLERKRAEYYAGKPKTFLSWLDSFYDETLPSIITAEIGPLLEAMETTSAAITVAREYCDRSKAELLEVAGESHADDLLQNVSCRLDFWTTRPAEIANSILEKS